MKQFITASQLYNHYLCPHRVWRDVHDKAIDRDPESDFLKLLWEKGVRYEEKVFKELGDFIDLSKGSIDERKKKTIEALEKKYR